MQAILKKSVIYILSVVVAFLSLWGCKTNKNTFIHRGYHNLTARYNGYYYATESIKDGEDKIRTNYKYDYDRLLPVFLIPTNETAKATFPEFDKAIKKSSNCIQRHTIKDKKGNEIYTAGKWIDNNWNVIGISHFYKREFFSGIEAFEYVIRSYKSRDKYKAMIWLAKSYNEIGAPSQAEPVIGLLKDDKNISKYAKKELPAVRADYYIRRGMYKEAEESLLAALKGSGSKKKNHIAKYLNRPKKSTRARYSFILGQLYELQNDNRKAIAYYKKTIAAKPDYDLVFNAKIKQARLFDVKTGNVSKLKRDLQAMTRDIKNKEYLDVIYYTLGEIYEKEKNEILAINNYKLSVKNSTQNPKQKALSYLKLGDISFEQAEYALSGAYYDSTMITLPKDYKDYDLINKRKTTLETLVGYIKTIQREDSLQRIAKMSETDRNNFIDKLIVKLEEEEEKKREEQENLLLQNQNPNYDPNAGKIGLPGMSDGTKGDWYFYNQTTKSFGINDFVKKWGNRKLEDNWRRSQKAVAIEDVTTPEDTTGNDSQGITTNKPKNGRKKDKKQRSFYLKDLPLEDSLIDQSNVRIVDAFYNLGSTYKEELNNNKKAIASFEELNKRFPENKYLLSTYYQLYRIYTLTRNQEKADYYKNKLLKEYPNSEYAQIIKNPNYQVEKNSKKEEVEEFYEETFNEYSVENYTGAMFRCYLSDSKFGKNDFSPKFAFIRSMCIGKLKGADSLESSLKQLQVLYPKDPVSKQAQTILDVLYELKHPSESVSTPTAGVNPNIDTLTLNLNSTHFVIAVYPDDDNVSNAFKSSVATFNTSLYSNSDLSISSTLFGPSSQLTIIKSFKNSEEALNYINNLGSDKNVFSGKVIRANFELVAITPENIQRLYKKKTLSYYLPFYKDHYQTK